MMPLDLHVLSLSLAFILSQDQTLHCKSIFIHPLGIILALFRMQYNSLTLFKYLYISIDGSIFLLVLLVLFINISKNLALRFKSGCKGKRFIFNCQTFFKVFFSFFLSGLFLRLSLRKGKMYRTRNRNNRDTCESDYKDKDFYFYLPNFFGSFFVLIL